MEYEPQHCWSETPVYDPHEYMYTNCYPNYQLLSNGEYLMTTARDFLDYPDDMMSEYEREECCYDDDLSYDSTDDEREVSPPQLVTAADNNNRLVQEEQVIETRSREEEEAMEVKRLLPSQSGNHGYPPPPSSDPPRLSVSTHHQRPREHRSPPAGGSRRSSSPTRGGLSPLGSRIPMSRSSGNLSSSYPYNTIKSPPTVPSSSSYSNLTTPTNDLGERGSPAGSSNVGGVNTLTKAPHPSKGPDGVGVIHTGHHGNNKQMFTQPIRRSGPHPFHQLRGAGSETRLFKPSKHPGFTRRHTVSVADRIVQFGGPKRNIYRTYSPDNKVISSGGIGGLDPYRDIEEDNDKRTSPARKKGVVTTEGAVTDRKEDVPVQDDFTSLSQQTLVGEEGVVNISPSSFSQPVPSLYSDQSRSLYLSNPLADRPDEPVSPTSSIEELSVINNRKEGGAKPHNIPPTQPSYQRAPPTSHQSHPHSSYNPAHNQLQAPSMGGSTYMPRPPQPLANVQQSSMHSIYSPYSSEQLSGPVPYLNPTQSQQPLGIATANLALAHNAAAKGDIAKLRALLSNGDIDALTCSHLGSNVLHIAASNGHLHVLQLVGKDIPLTAYQVADANYLTPAMLAIQGGHVECLKWLIEEGGVSLTVPDAGGETLLHHAAFNGQVVCLEYLLCKLSVSKEQVSYVDESGVTPAHFAAQRGHIDCLMLLISYNYDVIMADREHQKPLDWADAMGHHTCTHYLLMYEMCWQLSREVVLLTQQVQGLYHDNEQLYDALESRDKEHSTEIAQLLKQHQTTMQKVHEKYANYTVSLLRNENKDTPTAPPTTNDMPPSDGKGSSKGSGVISKGSSAKKERTKPPPLEIPPATPDEVMKRQLSSVEQQLFASRQVRKLHPVMATKPFSPLSPVLKKMSHSQEQLLSEAEAKNKERNDFTDKDKRSVTFAPSVTIVEGTDHPNNNESAITNPYQHPYTQYNKPHPLNTQHQSAPIVTKPSDNHHGDHQPHPYHAQYYSRHGNGVYHTPSSQPKLGGQIQQHHHAHSQSKQVPKDTSNSIGAIPSYKQNYTRPKEGADTRLGGSVVDSKDHKLTSTLSIPTKGHSKQHHSRSDGQKTSSLLQQQVLRLQHIETMKGKQDTSTKPDQQVPSSNGGGSSVLYSPTSNKPLKRSSLPLPPPPSLHPIQQHRSSLPVQRPRFGLKEGGLAPPIVQPHPLSVSQSSNRLNKHVHNKT